MQLDKVRVAKCLKSFDFKTLFTEELGWDCRSSTLDVSVNGDIYQLSAIAHKRGFVAYTCPLQVKTLHVDETISKIDAQVAKTAHEHIIVYTDSNRDEQIWQWAKRGQGKPIARRHEHYYLSQSGERLIQKLENLAFTLEDEETLTVVDVAGRARTAFDLEKITKKFYDRFQKEHDVFLKFIEGIPDRELERWYASVMLNRLMFIYFIQKKGFLGGDANYCRTKLAQSKATGKERFYKEFLCPLFFEGFAKPQDHRSAALSKFLGNIPYLNGGIFQKHQIEELHGKTIVVADTAFDKIFNFFDEYDWHLDDRPTRNDKEINPDVLGYIFEKYINQKQMGAYYTKEDITGYISQNTIIPRLFDITRDKCKIAFEGQEAVWKLLKNNPDRYIYNAVKHGLTVDIHSNPPQSLNSPLPLPKEIAAGSKNVSNRTEWNKSAPDEYALPTEIWREVVARRKRYEEVRAKLAAGEIKSINDFITYNLDIRQFAQDVVENAEGPELLRSIWRAIVGRIPKKSNEKFEAGISILDPTCGSGAFLFAALNVLEPLYEACLERMQLFVDDLARKGEQNSPEKFTDFKDIIEEVKKHPSPKYFIYKSIIINNLFGVDIMEEAIEICKLRLFLKLVAQVDEVRQIEPLPDIDFNIRAGNTLVGFTSLDEVRKVLKGDLVEQASLPQIEEDAQLADEAFQRFRQMQTQQKTDSGKLTEAKTDVKQRLKMLEEKLNFFLAGEYGVDPAKKKKYEKWQDLHKPLNWFVDFYGILNNGGFDVIIGNPPYVEYAKVSDHYRIKNYKTETCGNLYAFVLERNTMLIQNTGRTGMIVPHSAFCTDRMSLVQNLFTQNLSATWISYYCIRPAKLFVGVDQRLAIYISQQNVSTAAMYSSKYHRWNEEFRPYLLSRVQYADIASTRFPKSLPKISSVLEQNLWKKLTTFEPLVTTMASTGGTMIYYHNAPRYWIRAMDFVPYFSNEREGEQMSSHVKSLSFKAKDYGAATVAVLNSSMFYWWFITLSNCRDLTSREIEHFPVGLEGMDQDVKSKLIALSKTLMSDLKHNSFRKECEYKATGRVVYDEFYPGKSKHIIDEIDSILAKHYNLTSEEMDFVTNYEIKYRIGCEEQE